MRLIARLIDHAYRRAPRYGLMVKTLFYTYTGARVPGVAATAGK
ncbi:hypothetical protein [Deinococcus sp. DB0503]|nr:hypothetical protein [Deinococcus sp. DB0503]